MKITIWYGRAKPAVAMGKNKVRILEFAFKFAGWHSFKPTCRATVSALKSLSKEDFFEVSWDTNQFCFVS